MFEEYPGATVVAVSVALAPAIQRWWGGRTLLGLKADPVLPERLAAHRARASGSFILCFVFLCSGWPLWMYWTLPLMMITCGLATYQIRKVVFEETWSRLAYLSFCARAAVAMIGFWILIAALPLFALAAASWSSAAAVVLGIALVAWNAWYSATVRFLLRSRPLDEGPLLARFRALAQASTTGMPAFERVDLQGGSVVNAIALASIDRPAVVFTDSLLARLDPDESAAICAHEIAHLEYYNRARLRRLNLEIYGLIAGGVAVVLLSRLVLPDSMLPTALWVCFVVFALARRVRDRQKHETDSDVRAVALTGDPEALARALVKLHAFAHIPRRFDSATEQHATHPSLARRIRDIRDAVQKAPPSLGEDVRFKASNGVTEVTFGKERLHWREGEAALYGLSYAHLAELRLHARVSGPASLIVVERAGRRWEMALEAGDVSRVQAVLDLVDARVSGPVPAGLSWTDIGRGVTLLAVCLALTATQVAVAIVAGLAMARPAPPLVAATGVAALAAGGLLLQDSSMITVHLQPWLTIGLVTAGLILTWSAWQRRDETAAFEVSGLLALLGVLSALALAAVVMQGSNALRLNQAARAIHGATVLPLALAGALVCLRRRAAVVGAAVAVLASLTAATAGSIAFLDRFSSDPLLPPSERVTRIDLRTAPSAEFDLPLFASEVRLSPGGTHIAALGNGDAEGVYVRWARFHVGRLGARLFPVDADDVVFVDDAHAVALASRGDGAEVRKLTLDPSPAVVWQQHVPEIYSPALMVGPGLRWRLTGWDRMRQPVRVEGQIGAAEMQWTRWSGIDQLKTAPAAIAASGRDALVVVTRYDAMLAAMAFPFVGLLSPPAGVTQLVRIGPEHQTELTVSYAQAQCEGGASGDDRLVCATHDGVRTRITAIDPATGSMTPLATVDGHFTMHGRAGAGWLIGRLDYTPVAIRLGTRELFAFEEDVLRTSAVAATHRWFAAIGGHPRLRIRLFSIGTE